MRRDIATFPPPDEPNSVVGHDGSLSAEEITHLQGLGWYVAHWKSFSGIRLVQSYGEGVAKGLIAYNDEEFRAVEAIRKQMSKLDADGSDLKQKTREEVSDVMAVLQAPFRATNVNKGPLKKRASPTRSDDEE